MRVSRPRMRVAASAEDGQAHVGLEYISYHLHALDGNEPSMIIPILDASTMDSHRLRIDPVLAVPNGAGICTDHWYPQYLYQCMGPMGWRVWQ